MAPDLQPMQGVLELPVQVLPVGAQGWRPRLIRPGFMTRQEQDAMALYHKKSATKAEDAMTNTKKGLTKGFTPLLRIGSKTLFARAGFTLIEVVIATLIVTTVGAAIMTSFVNAARWANPSDLAAVYDVRGQLDQLNESVRQDTWSSNALSIGAHSSATVTYVVTSVTFGGVEAYRKVVATDT